MTADGVDVVVERLKARRQQIEDAIYARVREAVPDTVEDGDVEYEEGLRAAVGASVEYVLAGIVLGEEGSASVPIPAQTVAQARRAARSGIRVEAVLQRYFVGHSVLWECVMEEADHVGCDNGVLREMSRLQSALVERLTAGIALAHDDEREEIESSREGRLAQLVRALLAGKRVDVEGRELGYPIEAEHVGLIARGPGAREAMRGLAGGVDRRLLCVASGEGTVWAWLGGKQPLRMDDLQRTVATLPGMWHDSDREGPANASVNGANVIGRAERPTSPGVTLTVGEPARGLEGFRLTHRQAQAALTVSLRRPRALMRYSEMALLAAALKDQILARTLVDTYLAPLEDARGSGPVLRETLRAYLAAERSVSSAAAILGVVRKTVTSRLRTVEERLGRPLRPCPAELEVALALDEMGGWGPSDATAGGGDIAVAHLQVLTIERQ
jgi:hypothetical protein